MRSILHFFKRVASGETTGSEAMLFLLIVFGGAGLLLFLLMWMSGFLIPDAFKQM